MPSQITISEFVEETRDDYNSPITSTFVSRMPQCRNTISALEEVCYIFHRNQYTFPFCHYLSCVCTYLYTLRSIKTKKNVNITLTSSNIIIIILYVNFL